MERGGRRSEPFESTSGTVASGFCVPAGTNCTQHRRHIFQNSTFFLEPPSGSRNLDGTKSGTQLLARNKADDDTQTHLRGHVLGVLARYEAPAPLCALGLSPCLLGGRSSAGGAEPFLVLNTVGS